MVWFNQISLVPLIYWEYFSRRNYRILWLWKLCSSSNLIIHRPSLLTGSISKVHVLVLKVFCVAARSPLLFPHLSLQPLSCSLHHPSLPGPPPPPPSLALHPARLPGCTGTLWFRPPRCTRAHCSLSTAEPQLHQQEEQTHHLPPLSSFLSLHLSFSPISLGGSSSSSIHLSVPSLFTPWPPSAPLSVQILFPSFEY